MIQLRIDPEFRDKIPPLTEAEFQQLRENILADGEVYEPIAVWNGIIVDGHNRWRIIQEHPKIPYKVKEMKFADKWAAFTWMYKNQLGRRNLTELQREEIIGLMYKARKKSHGASDGFRGNQSVSSQNENLPVRTPRTDEILGKELGINHSTVVRSEHFADGIELIRKENPEAARKVLMGEAAVTKRLIRSVPKLPREEITKVVNSIIQGKEEEEKSPSKEKSKLSEARKLCAEIRKASADMASTEAREYTQSDLLDELCVIRDEFIDKVKRTLKIRKSVIGDGGGVLDVLVTCERKIIEIENEIGGKKS